MKTYPTDLTDSQWSIIDDLLSDNRSRKHEIRDIFDDIFYLLKNGLLMAYASTLFSTLGNSLLLFHCLEA